MRLAPVACALTLTACATAPVPVEPPLPVFSPVPTYTPPPVAKPPVVRVTPPKPPKVPSHKPPKAKAKHRPRVTVRHVAAARTSLASLPRDWQRIVMCESGGNLRARSSSGRYLGAFQIERGWWHGLDYRTATLAQQYALALHIWHIQSWRAWSCASIVGII